MARIGGNGSRAAGWHGPLHPPEAALHPALGLALLSLMGLELARLYLGVPLVQALADGAAVLVFILCLPLALQGWRERFLILLALPLLAAVPLLAADPLAVLARALAQAGFLMAFILLIGLLREAALTSPAVLACGGYLARRRQGLRYMSLHAGSHLLGVIVNVGAISLLAPLVQRGARAHAGEGEPDARALIDEQRQLAAVLRGMPWVIVWAPTTVTQALLPSIIAGIDGPRLAALGFAAAGLVFLLGLADDRLRWRAGLRALPRAADPGPRRDPPFPARALLDLLAVCGTLAGLAAALVAAARVEVVTALMAAAPVVLVAWLYVQHAAEGPGPAHSAVAARLRGIAFNDIPGQRREVLILGLSGFIGICVAAVVPVDKVAELLRAAGLAPWMLLALLPALIFAGAQAGLTPIMTVVVLGSVLGALPRLPADPTLLALSLACGWALAMAGGPFSSLVLLLSRVSGFSTTRIAWTWNLPFSILVLLALALAFALLAA